MKKTLVVLLVLMTLASGCAFLSEHKEEVISVIGFTVEQVIKTYGTPASIESSRGTDSEKTLTYPAKGVQVVFRDGKACRIEALDNGK